MLDFSWDRDITPLVSLEFAAWKLIELMKYLPYLMLTRAPTRQQ